MIFESRAANAAVQTSPRRPVASLSLFQLSVANQTRKPVLEVFAIYVVAICAVLNFILAIVFVFVMLGVLDALERLEKLAAGDPDKTES